MEQLGLSFSAAVERQVFTVAEITALVRTVLEETFANCWVAGEVSNCRRAPSGHYYFTLKDGEAQLKCVCFRQHALYLKVKPQDGLEVVARGRIGVYEARGEYQLYVEAIEPRGYGALQLAFEQLKRKLEAEGLFDEARKRPLPRLPRRIGIVTSPTGAAIADMLRIIERRFPRVHIRTYPALVQGEGAAADIVAGLRHFGETGWADVVIVGRGGGSLEDLWAFNEEAVARAIAQCPVPVISAVGHQTDFTIADFAADLRAPTPSAAAELAVPLESELAEAVRSLESRAVRAVRYRLIQAGKRLLEAGVERPAGALRRRLQQTWQRHDDLALRLRETIARRLRRFERRLRERQHALAEMDLRVRLAQYRSRVDQTAARLGHAARRRTEHAHERVETLARQLAALSPVAILERGYAIVSTMEGAIVRDAGTLSPGQRLDLRLHRGRADARVSKTYPAEASSPRKGPS